MSCAPPSLLHGHPEPAAPVGHGWERLGPPGTTLGFVTSVPTQTFPEAGRGQLLLRFSVTLSLREGCSCLAFSALTFASANS